MLYQIVSLLLEVAAGLLTGVCLLRLYMQHQRVPMSARSGNPMGPFMFALTDWLVLPLRRVLPALMNQFISLLKASSLVYFLGLVASQRELFQVGRDLNAQTGNLSPLVAAGLFYLLLTIPLTHLVNCIDNRLRRGKRPAEDEPSDPVTATQEMV